MTDTSATKDPSRTSNTHGPSASEDVYYERDAPFTEWLSWYRQLEYPRYRHPDVTVDAIFLTVDEALLQSQNPADCLKVLVVDRWTHPFRGLIALPGTFMRPDDPDETAVIARMLRDRFGYDPDSAELHLHQLQTFTGKDRDPRGQVISIANLSYISRGMEAIEEAPGVHWEPLVRLAEGERPLAFDHREILRCALKRVRDQFAWSPFVFWSLPQPFTVTDALKLRASLFGEEFRGANRKNFKRKYQQVWVTDHVEINSKTQMPLDFYRYEGAVLQ